eukprot:CAMPEP_0182479974 /NCGR_PEP_ID=MMETSP1319-20130603/35079_1 /TAXON_ID=172717 /ORGANISM="Bolidomonas pacifica, Strain RCC208" /LENGTH=134 /DNA_ID=CAMNT_0024681429 /DNA_START=158 /DNA_END=558 /DNA_ORIENTATION=-
MPPPTSASTGPSKKITKEPSKATVLGKVVVAIRALKCHKGSSRQAIAKYLKSEFTVDNANALKKALKDGVKRGVLEQRGQSFLVAGDEAIPEPADSRVEIVDVVVGEGEAEADDGDTVTVSYVGKLDDGHTFDS